MAPDVKSVVAHIAFISPAISNVPWVDNAFVLVPDKTSTIPANADADADVSLAVAATDSPAVAVDIAVTSAAVLLIASMLKSANVCNWSDVSVNARSRS